MKNISRFETVGEPNEPYIDEDGDKELYSNLDHIHTRDLVRESKISQNEITKISISV